SGTLTTEKHHRSSGPISDIFFDRVILVAGTTGTEADSHFHWDQIRNFRTLFKEENGGLHRGGIRGLNSLDLPFARGTELTEAQIRENNLLLFGNLESNAILRRYSDKLPLSFTDKSIRLGDRTYSGEKIAVFAVFPHPENPDRYIAVDGGVTPDAIAGGSHLS